MDLSKPKSNHHSSIASCTSKATFVNHHSNNSNSNSNSNSKSSSEVKVNDESTVSTGNEVERQCSQLSSITTTSADAVKKRRPMCARCRNHGVRQEVKGKLVALVILFLLTGVSLAFVSSFSCFFSPALSLSLSLS